MFGISHTVSYINGAAKDLGVSVEFVDSIKSQGGQSVNGSYSDGTIKISMEVLNNPNAETDEVRNMVAESIFKHEITHRTQQLAPKQFERFRNLAYEYVSSKNSSNLTEVEKQLLKEYESGVDMNYSEAVDEIVADFVGSADFAEHVAVKDKTLAQKILDVIRDILDKIGVKKYSEMDNIARAWEKAVNAAEKNVNKVKQGNAETGKVKYSIKYDNNGNKYWEIDTNKDIFKGLNTKEEYRDAAFNYLMGNKKNHVTVKDKNGKEIKFIRLSANEFTRGRQSEKYYNNAPEIYNKKMRIIPSLEDILLNASTEWHSPDMKNHKMFKENGFDNYRGKVRIDNVIFNTVVRVGKTNTDNIFYDINLEVDTFLPHTNSASENLKFVSTSNDNNIPQTNTEVNTFDKNNSENPSTKFSVGKTLFTEDDIKTIQNIGKKSINDFTSEEIKKTDVFAEKYSKELGTKSPFFRAWFGDWRANDNTPVNTVPVETVDLSDAILKNGDYYVPDTKWTIHAGTTLNGETRHYAREEKISVKALTAIKDILDNAVLLDTEVSEKSSNKKSENTAFMHKLYCPIKYNNTDYIAKVSVEEFLNPSNNIERKAYHLQSIKIETADGRATNEISSASTPRSDTVSINTVSQLFNLVKQNDKNFQPKEASKVVNEDGTPKVDVV